MGSSDGENERLAHPEFWDQRYTQAEGDQPTHEWFRTFSDLEPFFNKRLFKTRSPDINPRLLHLGSGDSVCLPLNEMCIRWKIREIDACNRTYRRGSGRRATRTNFALTSPKSLLISCPSDTLAWEVLNGNTRMSAIWTTSLTSQ